MRRPCETMPRRWNAAGGWTGRWHALFCAECRQARSADRKLMEGARALRREPVPGTVEQHVLERLGLPTGEAAPGRAHLRRMPALRLTAAAVVLLSAGVVVSQWLPVRTAAPVIGQVTAQPTDPRFLAPRVPRPVPAPVLAQTGVPGFAGVRPSGRDLPTQTPLTVPDADSSPHSGNSARTVSRSVADATGLPGDDLEYLNGQPVRDSGRWAVLSLNGLQRLEEQVRGSVSLRDDFITIPFPRLAATSPRQVAAAAESYKREAAVVDARLAREIAVAAKGMALVDLCERLKAESGLQLVASRSVADEKVSLFCRKTPLRDVMRQLSRPFGYTWLRSGKPGEYKYELVQDLKSQLLEEELRNRDRNEALVALDREMIEYRPYLTLSPEQARARLKTATAAEKPLLEKLAGPGWGALQMYFRLSPRDLAALGAGQTLKFGSPPAAGEQPLPADIAAGIPERPRVEEEKGPRDRPGPPMGEELELRLGRPGAAPPEPPAGPRAEVQLSIDPNELGQFTLTGGAGRLTSTPDGMQMWLSRDSLAMGQSRTGQRPQNAAANAALARDPALRERVDVRAESRGQRTEGTGAGARSSASRKVTSADVLEALHRATGMPVVADYYTRLYRPEAVMVKDRPLFDALTQIADTMRLRWNRETATRGATPWLQFRSVSFFHDRLKEVPNRLLSRWATARQKNGALSLEELIEIAQLSDAQLDGADMAEGARELFGLAEWDLARGRSARPHLRFLATFTPAQRQAVTGGDGLPFAKMTLAQQQQFIALAFGGRSEPGQSLEELASAALRIDYSPLGNFEWRPATADLTLPGAQPGRIVLRPLDTVEPARVRERTKEAALAAARRLDPNVTEAQIVPTQAALTVLYTTTGPEGRAPLLALRATGNSAQVSANRVRRTGGEDDR
jgi:hypothetical protein